MKTEVVRSLCEEFERLQDVFNSSLRIRKVEVDLGNGACHGRNEVLLIHDFGKHTLGNDQHLEINGRSVGTAIWLPSKHTIE